MEVVDGKQGPAGATGPQGLASQLADAVNGAQALLGCVLLRVYRGRIRRGMVVETEAYLQDDPASHSHGGLTRRNRSMFGPPGRAYVYRIHRVVCLNVVTAPPGTGEAVLIRAVEPLEGLEIMERARARRTVGGGRPEGYGLTNGPGKLCQALDVTLAQDGCDLLAGFGAGISGSHPRLLLEPRRIEPEIERGRRVGISKARDALLRFSIAGNRWVSSR